MVVFRGWKKKFLTRHTYVYFPGAGVRYTIACAVAVSPLRYDDLSRTTVTVIAAGWIGFGLGTAFAAGISAARASSPMISAKASAQALDSRADDMRRPIPVSAGRNPADGAASCLTYLIIWSDGCPTVFDRDFGTMFRFTVDPRWDRKTPRFRVRPWASPLRPGGARTDHRPALATGPHRRRDLGSHTGARSPRTGSRASTGSRVARSSRPTRADALPPSSTRRASRTRGPGSLWPSTGRPDRRSSPRAGPRAPRSRPRPRPPRAGGNCRPRSPGRTTRSARPRSPRRFPRTARTSPRPSGCPPRGSRRSPG